jgi:predicted GNAT superfamily acetyltransferase
MFTSINNKRYQLKILNSPGEMEVLEDLQRIIWPGNEVDIVPAHILLTFAHNGGVVIGAFETGLETGHPGEDGLRDRSSLEEANLNQKMIGFVFGFPGFYETETGKRVKHCSHQLGVSPQ